VKCFAQHLVRQGTSRTLCFALPVCAGRGKVSFAKNSQKKLDHDTLNGGKCQDRRRPLCHGDTGGTKKEKNNDWAQETYTPCLRGYPEGRRAIRRILLPPPAPQVRYDVVELFGREGLVKTRHLEVGLSLVNYIAQVDVLV
jgi:hypothetical protein